MSALCAIWSPAAVVIWVSVFSVVSPVWRPLWSCPGVFCPVPIPTSFVVWFRVSSVQSRFCDRCVLNLRVLCDTSNSATVVIWVSDGFECPLLSRGGRPLWSGSECPVLSRVRRQFWPMSECFLWDLKSEDRLRSYNREVLSTFLWNWVIAIIWLPIHYYICPLIIWNFIWSGVISNVK